MIPENCPASLQLRPASLADAPAVTECVNKAFAKWIPRIGRKPWPMLQDYLAVIPIAFVMIAEEKNIVVGVLVCSETDTGFLVDNVAVIPAHQGKGIGKTLLKRAEREAEARGYASLYLYTHELMTENIAMYIEFGYVEYERREEEGFRRIFLRKVIR